jgi:hypothetical protein
MKVYVFSHVIFKSDEIFLQLGGVYTKFTKAILAAKQNHRNGFPAPIPNIRFNRFNKLRYIAKFTVSDATEIHYLIDVFHLDGLEE